MSGRKEYEDVNRPGKEFWYDTNEGQWMCNYFCPVCEEYLAEGLMTDRAMDYPDRLPEECPRCETKIDWSDC